MSLGEPLRATEEVFRRAFELTARGRLSLTVAEAAELDALHAATFAQLSWRDRRRLQRYASGERAGSTPKPVEDGDLAPLMADAVRGLPLAQQRRVRDLYEKAIAAAVVETTAAPSK